MVKRLAAVASGATMLGATAMGALAAADLSTYPSQFVTDGTFNGYFVVGEKAASVDNLAMTDIASSMKVAKAAGATTTTTVEGDAWLVGTSSKKLEIANSNATDTSLNGEVFRDITTFIGDDELDALADGKWATNEQTYDFQQFLFFDTNVATDPNSNRVVKYAEDDNDKTADYLFLKNSRQIARYKLEFSSTAQSDVTDSTGAPDTTGTYLDDFDNTELTMLGKVYNVVLARRPLASSSALGGEQGIKLTLMAGATRDTQLEGESKTYTVGGKTYDVSLAFIDSDECKFTVNGEATQKLKVGDTYILSDKSEVGVSEVLYQDYAGGIHSCTFFVGAQKMELRDDQLTNGGGSYNVKVGSENIDGTLVTVTGTDNNATQTISTVEVNMTSEDDFFVGVGQKASDIIAAEGEEKEVLFGGWDLEYKGLTTSETRDLKIKTSGSKRYKLHLFDGDGNAVDIPVAYADSATSVPFGEETRVAGTARNNQKKTVFQENTTVAKDDYFLVTGGTASDGSAKSYLLSYKGADRQTKSSPKIQFKNEGSAETLEYSVALMSTAPAVIGETLATIKIGGYSFFVTNGSSTLGDDFNVLVDLDGDGAIESGSNTSFVDNYGSQWAFNTNYIYNLSTGPAGYGGPYELQYTSTGFDGIGNASNSTVITQTTPNADDYDNVVPSTTTYTITSTTDPEVRVAVAGVTLKTPEGKTDVSYGYTSMGTFLTLNAPTGDPQEVTLNYPKDQRLAQVYLTSGATKSSTSTTGDLTAVTVVDATKLDSEVASATAQNLIVVGGPCVNTVAAELLGNPADCTSGFAPGKARVKLWEHANGNVAMLVAGYSGADTRLAGKVLAHRWKELSGSEVEVEGTTYSDATLSAPSAMVK